MNVRELHTRFVQQISVALLALARSDVIYYVDESHTGSLRPPSCIKGGLAARYVFCYDSNRLQRMFSNFRASISLAKA